MSMITLNGSLLNVYRAPVRKAAEEGEKEKDKIQILGDVALPNGEVRKDLMTITVKDARKYQDLQGSEVSVSVGAFAPQKGTVIFFEVSA
jgi:hypothetical protein